MQIWPAIDLRGGKCVRLRQGDYQQETVFADDPAAVARQFAEQGAQHLHIVDLEGAREGLPVNLAERSRHSGRRSRRSNASSAAAFATSNRSTSSSASACRGS